MSKKLLLRVCTAIIFTVASVVLTSPRVEADVFGSYTNGDPDCPEVTYGPSYSGTTCDYCVTLYEFCQYQCEDVYYHQNYPGCTVTPPALGDLHWCINMCDDSMKACFRDGPCVI